MKSDTTKLVRVYAGSVMTLLSEGSVAAVGEHGRGEASPWGEYGRWAEHHLPGHRRGGSIDAGVN
jgi:hypothetical protein